MKGDCYDLSFCNLIKINLPSLSRLLYIWSNTSCTLILYFRGSIHFTIGVTYFSSIWKTMRWQLSFFCIYNLYYHNLIIWIGRICILFTLKDFWSLFHSKTVILFLFGRVGCFSVCFILFCFWVCQNYL